MRKIMMSIGVSVILLGTLTLSFAGNGVNMAEIYASFSGESIETVRELKRESGLTYGELAESEDFYEAFKAAHQEAKKEWIQSKVASGEITQAEADAFLERFESCDGDKSHMLKNTFGDGLKSGQGKGRGMMKRMNR